MVDIGLGEGVVVGIEGMGGNLGVLLCALKRPTRPGNAGDEKRRFAEGGAFIRTSVGPALRWRRCRSRSP